METPLIDELLRNPSCGNRQSSALTDEVQRVLRLCRMAALSVDPPKENDLIVKAVQLYCWALQRGTLGREEFEGHGFLSASCIALLFAALGDSNDSLKSSMASAWLNCMPSQDIPGQLDQLCCDVLQALSGCCRSWQEVVIGPPADVCMERLTLILLACDDVLNAGRLMSDCSSKHGVCELQGILLEAIIVIYNEVLPRILSGFHGCEYNLEQWRVLHTCCRRCIKAAWVMLYKCPSAEVGEVVNRLLQGGDNSAGVENTKTGRAVSAALDAFLSIVSQPGGLLVTPSVQLEIVPSQLLTRDLWIVYGHKLRALLLRSICALDTERCDYVLECFSGGLAADSSAGCSLLLFSLAGCHRPAISPIQNAESTSGADGRANDLESSGDPTSMAIKDLKTLFPDCGDVFLRACLKAFDDNKERTVDALLSDNLPPHVARMERKIRAAWIGKGGTDHTLGIPASGVKSSSLNSSAVAFVPALSQQDRAAMLVRNKAYEASFEEDARVLAAEYGDDYDDQYDDPSELSRVSVSAGGGGTDADLISRRDVIESVISVTGGASTSVGDGNKGVTKLLRREKKQREKAKKSTIVRSTGSLRGIGSEGVQDVQRFNRLLRSEEEEAAFWESMKNTNVPKERNRFDQSDESDDEGTIGADVPTSLAQKESGKPLDKKIDGKQTAPRVDPASLKINGAKINEPNKQVDAKSGGTSDVPNKKKFNTKKFDRYHQKDRSTRKFGV